MMLLFLSSFFSCAELVDGKFVWGTATAAYQVEGYRSADGRTKSIWDAFDTPSDFTSIKAVKPNGKPHIKKNQSGAQADEDYVRFHESADLTRSFGFGATRLSISWSRVMTYFVEDKTGQLRWRRNEQGIAHYKAVLRKYASLGISVALTMFHWDLPLVIEDYANVSPCGSAWLCHAWIGEVFEEYATLLLHEFKDMVTWWLTINEPGTIINCGYVSGTHAPGRCSDRKLCYQGDSTTEPYVAAKGLLLAHARAFRAWEKAGKPGVSCGMVFNGDWRIPFDVSSEDDRLATLRSLEWQAPLFADPIYLGKLPELVTGSFTTLGEFLGKLWTKTDMALVHGTHDGHFFMNHYTTNFARKSGEPPAYPARTPNIDTEIPCNFICHQQAETSGYSFDSRETPIGTPSSNGWLFNYGSGLGEQLAWYNKRYKGMRYIITENGWGNQTAASKSEDLLDIERCNYYRDYIGNLSAVAARDNITVDGYFAWSLMDNFEWGDGYTTRFGLTYVDFNTQHRTAKLSATWFRSHITSLSALPSDGKPLPACDSSLVAERLI